MTAQKQNLVRRSRVVVVFPFLLEYAAMKKHVIEKKNCLNEKNLQRNARKKIELALKRAK